MTTHLVSPFDVTRWDSTPYDEEIAGPRLFRVKLQKKFRGALEAESTGELLMCVADPANIAAGAGYVVSERVVGQMAGRAGSFMLQHWGVSGGGGPQRALGHVVPGSGTGELTGLLGTIEISPDHALTMDYTLP